jgi:hypothetical protein
MTRTLRLIATAVLGLLLLSWTTHRIAILLGYSRLPGALLSLLWLMPVAAVAVAIARSSAARAVLARMAESRVHLAVSILTVIGFLFTNVPFKTGERWQVTYLAIASTLLILVVAVGYPVMLPFTAIPRRVATFLLYRLKPTAFLLVASGAMLVLTNLISRLVFHHMPHVQDTVDQVFQGRIFASGRVTLPARFDDYFFSFVYIVNDGVRVFAEYPFGHSLLLALGSLIRAEWLVNPLLGSAQVIVLYFLGKEVYDEKTGRIAALLGLASPFLLFMSSEYVNHVSALLFLSLFLLFFFHTIRPFRAPRPGPPSFVTSLRPSALAPLLSGLCLAMALNIRPLSALAVSTPIAGYAIYLLLKWRGKPLPAFVAILVPVLLGLGAFGLYNYLTTGDPLLPGYKAYGMLEYNHAQWGLGFGARGFEEWGHHTPLRGLIQAGSNLYALNLYLFESPFPGLLLVLLLFLAPARKPVDWVLLASFAALPALYFFYWFQDLWFGPRFLYEGLALIFLLGARGLVEFPDYVGHAAGPEAATRTRNTILIVGTLSLFVACTVGLPRLLLRYAYNYDEYQRVRAKVAEGRIGNAVIFLRPPHAFYYGAAVLDNALDLNGPIVYAVDRGPENYLLMQRFPGRAYYRYADPDTFLRLTNLDSLRSTPEIQDLAQAGEFVRRMGTAEYRTILLPYREAGVLVDTGQTACRTFREISYELLRRPRHSSFFLRHSSDLLPALAVFMPDDPRRYSPLFSPMRDRRDYTANGCQFTLLFSAESGKAVVYDIRTVSTDNGDARP